MSDDSSSSDSSDPYGQEVAQVPQFMRQRSPSANSEPEQEESPREDSKGPELKFDLKNFFFGEELEKLGIDLDGFEDLEGDKPLDELMVMAEENQGVAPVQRHVLDSESSSSSDDFELPVLYERYSPEADEQERVISFSKIFLPTKPTLVQKHIEYNKKLTEVRELQDGAVRDRKRRTKQDYKTVCQILKQKAGFLPISQYLEDFYYLQGCNKAGVPLKRTSTAQ
jgi:hypothetical protein